MSKFEVVLCVVLLASAANAVNDVFVEQTPGKMQLAINSKISEAIGIFNATLNETNATPIELIEIIAEFDKKYLDEIDSFQNKTRANIENLSNNVNGVDIIQCIQFSPNNLQVSADIVVNNTRLCTAEQFINRLRHVAEITIAFNYALGNFTEISKEALSCNYNSSCLELVDHNATKVLNRFKQDAGTYIKNIKALPGNFKTSLGNCKTNNGFKDLHSKSLVCIEAIRTSIQKAIDRDNTVSISKSEDHEPELSPEEPPL